VSSDPKIYNDKPIITDISVGGVVGSEVESVQSKTVICEMLSQVV
jgi:hypothetical protein